MSDQPEVQPNILIRQFPLGPLQTNSYVVTCEWTGQVIVIDPAWDGAAVADFVREAGWHVSHILLTHSHFDHVGGLAALTVLTGAPVHIHPDAAPMLARAAEIAAQWGVTLDQPVLADKTLAEGDVIEAGAIRLEVLYTPGHAPGHVSFYLREYDVLFDGDVLFQGSIGRTDLPGGDLPTLMTSIREKILTLPDETQVLSGHGAVTTIGAERRTNPFLQEIK